MIHVFDRLRGVMYRLRIAILFAFVFSIAFATSAKASHNPQTYPAPGYGSSYDYHYQCSGYAQYVCWWFNENNLWYYTGDGHNFEFNGLTDQNGGTGYFACWGYFWLVDSVNMRGYYWPYYNSQPISTSHTFAMNQYVYSNPSYWPYTYWQIVSGPGGCSDPGSTNTMKWWIF